MTGGNGYDVLTVEQCGSDVALQWVVDAATTAIRWWGGDSCVSTTGGFVNQLVLNELYVGSIAQYGPWVTDHCITVCEV